MRRGVLLLLLSLILVSGPVVYRRYPYSRAVRALDRPTLLRLVALWYDLDDRNRLVLTIYELERRGWGQCGDALTEYASDWLTQTKNNRLRLWTLHELASTPDRSWNGGSPSPIRAAMDPKWIRAVPNHLQLSQSPQIFDALVRLLMTTQSIHEEIAIPLVFGSGGPLTDQQLDTLFDYVRHFNQPKFGDSALAAVLLAHSLRHDPPRLVDYIDAYSVQNSTLLRSTSRSIDGDSILDALVFALTSSDASHAEAAFQLLASADRAWFGECVLLVLPLLEHRDQAVRERAERLLELVASNDPVTAAKTLLSTRDFRLWLITHTALERMLNDKSPFVRRVAQEAIDQVGVLTISPAQSQSQ